MRCLRVDVEDKRGNRDRAKLMRRLLTLGAASALPNLFIPTVVGLAVSLFLGRGEGEPELLLRGS
jgi:hypothetical protein